MSKYVRTNDGRIIDTTKERETKLCNQRAWCPEKGFVVYENDIIKQADTIEELCDGFIGVPDEEWFEKHSIGTSGVDYFQRPFDLKYCYRKKRFC